MTSKKNILKKTNYLKNTIFNRQHIFGFTKDGLKKDIDQAGQDSFDIKRIRSKRILLCSL